MRSRAIELARDNDVVATAQNITLRNPIGGARLGFLYIAPVYRAGTRLDTKEQQHNNIHGVFVASFQTNAVIDSILARPTLPHDMSIYLYLDDAGAHAMPIYARAAAGEDNSVTTKSIADLAGLTYWSGHWDLVVVPQREGLISYYRAWLVFAAGLVC